MKSPFPGMDPFLERHWRDVHASLVLHTRNQLRPQLGLGLKARVEERVVLETPKGDEGSSVFLDLRIVTRSIDATASSARAAAGAIAEPLVIECMEEVCTEGHVQVLDVAQGNHMVTVIEILSPTNKRPDRSRAEHQRKQAELIEACISPVEIDLLRGGMRTLQVPEHDVPAKRRATYAACVQWGHRPTRFEFDPMPLRERPPAIGVPLRESDCDVRVDFHELADRAHEDGAYDEADYADEPTPAFEGDEAAWVIEMLSAAHVR